MSISTSSIAKRQPVWRGAPRDSTANRYRPQRKTHPPGAAAIVGRVAASFPACALLTAAALATTASLARAATVLEAEVTETDGHYRMTFEALLQAPYPHIYRLLTDYPGLPRFNPHIENITLLPTTEGDTLEMRVVSRACVVVFCKTVMHVQQVREDSPGDIVATVVPEKSDLRQGIMRWRIVPEGSQTRILFEGHMTPAFWVPPLVGPAAIKHSLRTEAIELFENLERGAIELVGSDAPTQPTRLAHGSRFALD